MNTICPKCQAEIPEANVNPQTGIAMCAICGEVFSLAAVNPPSGAVMPQGAAGFCAQCGAKLGEGLQFCTKCGAPVGVATVGAVQAVSPQSQSAPLPNPTVATETLPRKKNGMAIASFVTGILGLLVFILDVILIVTETVGMYGVYILLVILVVVSPITTSLILGIISYRKHKHGLAKVGIIISLIVIVLFFIIPISAFVLDAIVFGW